MKQNKKLLIGIGLICSNYFSAQQASTTNSPGVATNGLTSNQFWSRAGNTNINGTNNIFGTLWNSPIYTQTMGLNRMKLNGNVAYSVNGFTGARNGFLLLGARPKYSKFWKYLRNNKRCIFITAFERR